MSLTCKLTLGVWQKTPYAERYDFALQRQRYDKSGISLPNLYYRMDFQE